MTPPSVTDLATSSEPGAPVGARIQALDVLRGVAVGGILLANVLVFFGLIFRPPDVGLSLPGAWLDGPARVGQAIFIEGKFYSIFSLLFGIGFGLQLAGGGEAAVPRFTRRLRILLAFGAVHAVFVWAGDILMLYALLGFTLPYFARKADRALLRWVIGLLAAPAVVYGVVTMAWLVLATPSEPAPADGSVGVPPQFLELLIAMGRGDIGDAFVGNLAFLVGRWADLFATMRFPKVLGMFVLGLWAVRAGIVAEPAAHRTFIASWARRGWVIGLPANVVVAWIFVQWEYLPPSTGALLGVVAQTVGYPMLAVGYACTIALLVISGSRLLAAFAPVGRMALTNYLMHSVICVVLSYGFGFGLWWNVSVTTACAVALAIVAIQMPLSAWWLARFQFGPAEWLWRRLTYGRALPLRRR